jgi:hypothetical protein
MKKTIQIAALSIILCGGMIGCRPEKKTLGPKPSQTEGISNTGWILSRVDQIDVNVQLAFVESDTLLNVTETFIDGTPMEFSFTKDGSYSIASGAGSQLFKINAGSWKFDNADYPSKIILDDGTAGVNTVSMMRPVRPQDNYLVLKYNKICGGKRTVSYHLTFSRK